MPKNKAAKVVVQTTKNKQVVNTENEFATEFGEGLYGGHAREAFKQQQARNNNKSSK